MSDVRETVRELALRTAGERNTDEPLSPSPDPVWQAVRATGTRLWLDTGDIPAASALWTAEFEALTTNNTLLNREVQKGQYDDLVRRAANTLRDEAPGLSESERVLEIAFVLNAVHGLRLVHRFGANVSVELHTDLAHDVDRTVAYGLRYFEICPEKFYVKVPLTAAGFVAARRLHEEGVPVNFTLGFSARQNVLAAAVAQPRYVNVFMGRLNAFVADSGLGDGRNVGEKATLSTQRQVAALREQGRTEASLIGASMRGGGQVATLAGLDVYTMPTKVAEAYHGAPADELAPRVTDDPAVPLNDGVSLEDFSGGTLWDVPAAFVDAALELAAVDPAELTPELLRERLAGAGFGNLLPAWSEEDLRHVAEDGKIPRYERWHERLVAKEIGMDALMNISGLLSFTADQRELDDRVRSLMG